MLDCREFERWLNERYDEAVGFDEAMRAHAEVCPACRAKLDTQRRMLETLRHLDDGLSVPLKAQSAWRKAVREEAAKRRRSAIYRWAGVAAAVCVLTVGVAGMMTRTATNKAAPLEAAPAAAPVEAEEAFYLESDGLSYAALEDAAMEESAGAGVDAGYTIRCADLAQAREYLSDIAAEYGGSLSSAGADAYYIEVDGDLCAEFVAALAGAGDVTVESPAEAVSGAQTILVKLVSGGN